MIRSIATLNVHTQYVYAQAMNAEISPRGVGSLFPVIILLFDIDLIMVLRAACTHSRTFAPSTPSWYMFLKPRYLHTARRDTYGLKAQALLSIQILLTITVSAYDRYNNDFTAMIMCTSSAIAFLQSSSPHARQSTAYRKFNMTFKVSDC